MELSVDAAGRTARVGLVGDLDYGSTGGVVTAVSRLIVEQPRLRALRLGFAAVDFCDSAGLSGLVEIHRRTSGAGVRLHLDERPDHLDRMLGITGLLGYLMAQPAGDRRRRRAEQADETGLG